MEEIISMIIPLLAIAGWLFGMFNKDESGKGDKRRGKPVLQRNPTPTVSGGTTTETRAPGQTVRNAQGKQTKAHEQRGQEQDIQVEVSMNRRPDFNQNEKANMPVSRKQVEKPVEHLSTVQTVSSQPSIRKNLTKKGLVNSVVMAEVLGSPRALKPYSRHTKPNRR